MHLEILTPEKKIFEGEAVAVQLPGSDGLFQVLDNHAPIISSLKNGKIKITQKENKNILVDIKSGFAEVLKNKVSVLVEDAVIS